MFLKSLSSSRKKIPIYGDTFCSPLFINVIAEEYFIMMTMSCC